MNFIVGYGALLSYKYWINPRPVPLGPTLVGSIFSFFAWFLIASLVLYILSAHFKSKDFLKSEAVRKFAGLMLITGLLGNLFLFFAYEQIPLLGMRFWFLVIFILFSVLLVRAIIFVVHDFPQIRSKDEERKRLEKYLPKGK